MRKPPIYLNALLVASGRLLLFAFDSSTVAQLSATPNSINATGDIFLPIFINISDSHVVV